MYTITAYMEVSQRLWQLAISELIRSNTDPKHSYKTCVLTTVGIYPEARWVVKRGINSEDLSMLIYTDSRSCKVSQIEEDNRVSLLYYCPQKKLQIRINALAEILDEGELYDTHFKKAQNQLKDYTTLLAPGTILYDTLNYNDEMHFFLVVIKPQKWDILELGDERHFRASYELENNKWIGTERVP